MVIERDFGTDKSGRQSESTRRPAGPSKPGAPATTFKEVIRRGRSIANLWRAFGDHEDAEDLDRMMTGLTEMAGDDAL